MRALTGAPALLLGWASASWVGTGLVGTDVSHYSWLPSRGVLTTWWGAACLLALAHVAAALGDRRAGRAHAGNATPAAPDEGRTLRIAAGTLALVGTATLLGVLAPAAFGDSSPAEVYARIDALLATLPGVGAACVVGAAAGLYVAEELPRALGQLGAPPDTRFTRAALVISIVVGAMLFAVTMNIVSQFSVGRALVGAASGTAP